MMSPLTKARHIVEGHICHGVRPVANVLKMILEQLELAEAEANAPKPLRCPSGPIVVIDSNVELAAREFLVGRRTLDANDVAQLASYIVHTEARKKARCA